MLKVKKITKLSRGYALFRVKQRIATFYYYQIISIFVIFCYFFL